MKDPSLDLQKALFEALTGSAAVAAAMGGAARVYDRAPDPAVYPYVQLGDVTVTDDGDTCHEGAEAFITLDVWSQAVGKVEAKTIARAVAEVVDAPIAVVGHEIITHEIDRIRHLPGGDGLTSHSQVVVRYQTAPTA